MQFALRICMPCVDITSNGPFQSQLQNEEISGQCKTCTTVQHSIILNGKTDSQKGKAKKSTCTSVHVLAALLLLKEHLKVILILEKFLFHSC